MEPQKSQGPGHVPSSPPTLALVLSTINECSRNDNAKMDKWNS